MEFDRRAGSSAPLLSIVLPYYRKIEEFRHVLPLNVLHLQRSDCEVILVLDEPSEEEAVLELIAGHPAVQWRVIVNDRPHAWRSPSVAINVGLRHAAGTFVLVVSPESVFVDDIPSYAIDVLTAFPGCVALGTVAFVDYDLSADLSLSEQIVSVVENEQTPRTLYGSIAARRSDFFAVQGYDETIAGWGGDDDNIRIRMEMAGRRLLACPELSLVHVTLGRRPPRRVDSAEWKARMRTVLSPETSVANVEGDWGREFARIARDWRHEEPGTDAAAMPPATPAQFSVHHTLPTGSRRICRICFRQIYFQQPSRDCICRNEGLQPGLDGLAALHPLEHERRIACVMQLRNESAYLPGCLEHLRGYVDAVIALDDGSTDETRAILQQHSLVTDILVNPASETHVWDERENKRRLLERARDLGFEWVLACDADERYEHRFLQNLRRIAAAFPAGHLSCIAVRVRELWDSPTRYRVDGIWRDKAVVRFFALPDRISFAEDKRLHGRWPPDESRLHGLPQVAPYNLYHCKTIRREDRIRRRDFYVAADPDHQFQSAGYDYLVEEGPQLRTEEIPPAKSYDLTTLASVHATLPDQTPAISVVVFGYRNEDTIVRAVQSLFEQNVGNLAEIIVVVSGGDRSADRVRRQCTGVTVVERTERLFPGGACNVGIKAARSPVVAFLAGDCVAEPGWISTRVALHAGKKRRAVTCAISNGGPHSPAGWASHYLLFASRLSGRRGGTVLPPDPAVHGHSVPRDELLAMGGFREDLRIGEDTDLAFRLHQRGLETFFDPAVRTAHFEPAGTIAMLIDQFRRGRRRARAGTRTRSTIALVARIPRDVFVRLQWVVLQAWRNGGADRRRIVLFLPWLAAGAAANCMGWLREQLTMVSNQPVDVRQSSSAPTHRPHAHH